MTEKQLRDKIVATAQAWLGCKEANGTHRQIIDLYNSHKPLARGYKVKYTDAWCDTYVSAVAIKAGMTDIIPTECGCEKHIALFKEMGRWQENDAYAPQPGDYIFYDWDDSGKGDCAGAADHVGIVVYAVGGNIKVIEGNKGNAVDYRTMKINGRYIRGYGLPDYAGKAVRTGGSAAAQKPTTASTTATRYTVAAGDTLGRIAARNGTTVAALAEINGIQNVNMIRVGQVIYLTAAAAACGKLAALGVINSPDYWAEEAASGKVKNLDLLLTKAAARITKAGPRSSTVANGVGSLVAAGVIDTPDYWLANHSTFPSLGALLCALGGAVK